MIIIPSFVFQTEGYFFQFYFFLSSDIFFEVFGVGYWANLKFLKYRLSTKCFENLNENYQIVPSMTSKNPVLIELLFMLRNCKLDYKILFRICIVELKHKHLH